MIDAQGNYKFLDFSKEKPKFIDTFVKFYGEQYRKIITDRINKIEYVPYLDRDFVSDYYGKILSSRRDELVKYFCWLGAYAHDPKMDDLIWNTEEGGSPLIFSLFGGPLYQKMRTIDTATKEKIAKYRRDISMVFGIPTKPQEEQYKGIRKLYDVYRMATKYLAGKNPPDVIYDAQKYRANSAKLIKYFLASVRTDGLYTFTSRDVNTIFKKDFANGDMIGMDSYGLFYVGNLDTPGLISYFTTDKYQGLADINKTKNIDLEAFETMIGQLKALYVMGAKLHSLKPSEIESNEVEFSAENILKIMDEYNWQAKNNSRMFIAASDADTIEGYREVFAMQLSSGCRFRSRLDRSTSIYTQGDNDELHYCMYPNFTKDNPNKPNTTIFFNEAEYFDRDILLSNLIHEIDHCVTHDKATKMIKKYEPVVKKGTLGLVNRVLLKVLRDRPRDGHGRAIVQEGLHYDKYYTENGIINRNLGKAYGNEGMMDLEENINERLAQELAGIYLHYYESPFKDSALYDEKTIAEEKEDVFQCQYMLWDSFTEDFYNKFYSHIKKSRIDHKYPFYYGAGKLAENKSDRIMNYLKDKYDRKIRPQFYMKQGIVDYHKVEKLGNLITDFKQNLMPLLDLDSDEEFYRLVCGDYSEQSPEVQEAFNKYLAATKKIMASIAKDDHVLMSETRDESSDFTPTNIM